MKKNRLISFHFYAVQLLVAPLLVACVAAQHAQNEDPQNEDAQIGVSGYMRTGQYVSCVPFGEGGRVSFIGENSILVRRDNEAFLSMIEPACLAQRDRPTSVRVSPSGGEVCEGDMATFVDAQLETTIGECKFGRFELLLKTSASPETTIFE